MKDAGRRFRHGLRESPPTRSEFHDWSGLDVAHRDGFVNPAKLEQHGRVGVLVSGNLISVADVGIQVERCRSIDHAHLADDPVVGRVDGTAVVGSGHGGANI